MTGTNSLFTAVLRQPVSFAILVLSIVILIVWFDYKSTIKQTQSDVTSLITPNTQTDVSGLSINRPIQLSPPGSQTNIIGQFNTGSGQQQSGAPAIDALLGRLEEKVKADPGNLDNRILLAQTYKELGRIPDATKELRNIQNQDPNNSRANLVLASILSQSNDQIELEESLQVLAKISGDDKVQPYLVELYRGDTLMNQKNLEGALKSWKQALVDMPKSDARYTILEKNVMDLSKDATSAVPAGS